MCAVGLWRVAASVGLWSVGSWVKFGGEIGGIHVFDGLFHGFHLVVAVGFCVVPNGSLFCGLAVEGSGAGVGVELVMAGDANRGGFKQLHNQMEAR